jgi:hypothetical protein
MPISATQAMSQKKHAGVNCHRRIGVVSCQGKAGFDNASQKQAV